MSTEMPVVDPDDPIVPSEPGEETPPQGGDEGTGSGDADPDGSQSTTDADPPEDGTEGEGTGDGEGESTPEKSGAFAKLLAKYDGDEEALAEGVWQQGNSLSEMNKRLKSLEGMLQKATAEPEPDVDAIIAEDPYVKEAADELRSSDTEVKELEQEQVQIIAEHGRLEKLVAKLEGKLSSAAPEDRDDIRDELRDAKGDRKEAERNYRESKRNIADRKRDRRSNAQKFRSAEDQAKSRLDRERQQSQSREARSKITQGEFSDAMVKHAKRYKIPTDGKTFNVLSISIRDRIQSFISTLPKNAPGIPIDDAVSELMEEYVEAMGLESRFQRTSTRKGQAVAGKGKPSVVGASSVKGDKEGEWDAAYVRKRAAELLP